MYEDSLSSRRFALRLVVAFFLGSLPGLLAADTSFAHSVRHSISIQQGLGSVPVVVQIDLPDGIPLGETERVTKLTPAPDLAGNNGSATARVKAFPQPYVHAVASAEAGPVNPIGVPPYARTIVDVRLSYGITLLGPPGPSVSAPIRATGRVAASSDGSAGVVRATLDYAGGPLVDLGGGSSVPRVGASGVEWTLDAACGVGCSLNEPFSFSSTITVLPLPLSFVLEGKLDLIADEPSESLAAWMYLDPYVELDPDWAAAHPDYTLVVEPTVGNVPEPTVGALTVGVLRLAALARRRRPLRARS